MDVRKLTASAGALLRSGKFAQAAEAYRALAQAQPTEYKHLVKLGDSYRRDGKKDRAVEAYRSAAESYARDGEVIKAIAACKLVLEIDPRHREAQEALATLCARHYSQAAGGSGPGAGGQGGGLPSLGPAPLSFDQIAAEELARRAAREAGLRAPERAAEDELVTRARAQAAREAAETGPGQAGTSAGTSSADRGTAASGGLRSAPAQAPAASRGVSAAALLSAEIQQQVPLFWDLPREAFVDLLDRVAFHGFDEGDSIVREGEIGKSIFVLASGKAKVVKGLGTPQELVLAELAEGAYFGEMALLNGTPRGASVVATEDCDVLELSESTLRVLAIRHPKIATNLKRFYQQRALSNVLSISPLFRAFGKEELLDLLGRFRMMEVPVDEVLVREGVRPDALFVVVFGAVLVKARSTDGRQEVPVAVLREGDVFGEMSLLTRGGATATLVAKRRTLLLRLSREEFDELAFAHPKVMELITAIAEQRKQATDRIVSGREQAPRDAVALL